MAHPASQHWIRCEDCFTIFHNESGQEIILMDFLKEIYSEQFCHFGKKWYGHLITLDLLSGFFMILHNKRDQEVHENFVSCFLRKSLIWGNLIFLDHFLIFDWL